MKLHLPTTLYLVRHGKTELNEKSILQGHRDSPDTHLTAEGKKDVELLLKEFKKAGLPFSAIFSSDLTRSLQTANILATSWSLPVQPSPLLRGKRMGKYEGVSVKKYREEKGLQIFETLPETELWDYKIAPDVESNNDVLKRVKKFLKTAVTENPGAHLLIVTHGGVIRNLLFHLGWAKQRELRLGSVDNMAYIKVCSFDGVDFKLENISSIEKNKSFFK